MSKSIEISAKTQEEAVSKGLEELGASISEVTIDILQEGSKGLFGLFGSRLAKVRLTLKDDADTLGEAQKIVSDMFHADEEKQVRKEKPRREAKKPAQEEAEAAQEPAQKPQKEAKPAAKKQPAPEAPKEAQNAESKGAEPKKEKKSAPKSRNSGKGPRQETKKAPAKAENEENKQEKKTPPSPEEVARSIEMTRSYLTELTRLMGVEVTMEVTADEEGSVKADMQGDTLGILIGRRGETLDALQYLTSLYVNKDRDQYTRITLDSEHYRAKREEALVRLANRMANRVQKTGRKVSMEAMNPYERRIMHSALQSNDAVYTHSEGEGINRHVVISPKKADKTTEA